MPTDSSILGKLNIYNLRVNSDLIKHIVACNPGNERIVVLMSHIINSHQVWLERIGGKSMSVKPFDVRTIDELVNQNEDNFRLTNVFITERDLNEKISYINTKRQRFENTICEMLLHLFNHGTYHRGQINQLLVQEGKPPMPADFIVYNRTEII